ncbi:SRPBCC family protein [Paenibacillus sp. LHD-117]|uniref:SRPBCC family protein n=1 Tax=Paenibacillus sp. LHD-117 TaxID=3071412 RepID=UPI0027DEFB65|nr:SRPBCC family protein [Paenibacillus sp. LHD-117]MDQ6423444.1 SRPBCC family protein [Paenibacillus sp. LHD-117]
MAANDNELVAARVYDVPRELAFRAWTTPDWLAQWWGPEGFSNTFHEIAIEPGGHWKYTMHGPDGTDYPNHSTFVEVVPHERIVIDHLSGHEFRITATFEELGGRTKVTFRQRFKHAEDFEQAKPYCEEANEQNMDRLGELLGKVSVS